MITTCFRRLGVAVTLLPVPVLGACSRGTAGANEERPAPARAVAPSSAIRMIDAQGDEVGTASLVPSQFGGLVMLRLRGLPPGEHGLHIHEAGKCEPPSFQSAGPHLNPAGKQHGTENPQGPHLGDLPNITVRQDGTVDTTLTVGADLFGSGGLGEGQPARSLMVHAKPDDYRTDPSGNSGDRIACGVIQPAKG